MKSGVEARSPLVWCEREYILACMVWSRLMQVSNALVVLKGLGKLTGKLRMKAKFKAQDLEFLELRGSLLCMVRSCPSSSSLFFSLFSHILALLTYSCRESSKFQLRNPLVSSYISNFAKFFFLLSMVIQLQALTLQRLIDS